MTKTGSQIRIIVEASTKFDRFRKQWGLSILVDGDVLFDTFSDPKTLSSRMRRSRVDMSAIRHVVISHDHWDHTGGLWWLLEQNKNCTVYVCANSGENLREKIRSCGVKVVEVTGPMKIKDNISSTGEIAGSYAGKPMYEQALVINEGEKLAVITGCSHPGILEILRTVRGISDDHIAMVMGGFHLVDKTEEELGNIVRALDGIYKVNTIAPFHCTGKQAVEYFKECMPDQYIKAGTGDSFLFDEDKKIWMPG
ncbi:MAG: MBL fold metallo-hydrolase [Spirochaetaceae bacterium]|nr:MAG: MBL fold metallo-hydrolase [Spirochaetaceae bacterium]